MLATLAIGFAFSTPDPGALRAVLQQVVDQQALAWNASFSLGLVWGAAAEGVAVAGGLSNHATGTVVTPSTRYPLGSATKLHTAIACLQAAERGMLDLDAPIAQYVDPFLKRTNGTTLLELYKHNANISAVTTRQALAMRSGVADYDDAAVQAWSFDRANTGKDLSPYDYLHADDLTPKAFTFAPGDGGAYSSIGYALAGLALAAVHGAKDWFDLDQRLVVPKPLLDSLPGYQFAGRGPCSQYPDVVEQYAVRAAVTQESADWVTVAPVDLTWASCLNGWTFGNLAATPAAVARVVHAAFGSAQPRILSSASLAQMQTFQPLTTGWSTGLRYGLGVMDVSFFEVPGVPPELLHFVGHAGQDYGSGAFLHYYNAALDASIVLATSTAPGMNCSLANLAENTQAQVVSACHVWEAVLVAFGKVEQGALRCSHFTDHKARTRQAGLRGVGLSRTAAADAPYGRPTATSTGTGTASASATGTGAEMSPEIDAEVDAEIDAVTAAPVTPALLGAAVGAGAKPYHCATHGACVGVSAALDAGECAAWKALHARAGGTGWTRCAAHFADPCGCSAGVACSSGAGDAALHITSIDLSGSGLRGELPAELSRLHQLTRLNLSSNVIYGAAPALLPYARYVRGCDLTNTALSCPLPVAAAACHAAGAAPPACTSPVPRVSAPCGLAVAALYASGAFVNASAVFYSSAGTVEKQLGSRCVAELTAHATCHLDLDWNSSAGGRALLAYVRGVASAVSPGSQLCLMDTDQNRSCGMQDCELFIACGGFVALPKACAGAADRQALLDFGATPAQCAKAGATGCRYKYSAGGCN